MVECSPNQSLITRPSKPHSPRSTPRSIASLSAANGPLIRLYAVITASTPASLTTASNGTRYSSRNVRSSICESIDMRSNSVSLPTKCLTHAATPSDCRPCTYPTAMRDVR